MAKPASSKQLRFLKSLAERTGTSFTLRPGMTMREARAEIERMQELHAARNTAPASGEEREHDRETRHEEKEAARVRDRQLDNAQRYSPGRFDEAKGYGSHASYRGPERDPADAAVLTDAQERQIITLQDGTGDQAVQNTVAEAAAYLDEQLARPEEPPTDRQLAYLHSLERKLGIEQDKLTHPGTKLGASRRIERYARQLEQRDQPTGVDEDLAATLALTGAASPHSIEEASAASAAEASTASTVPHRSPAGQDLGERAPSGR